MSEFDRFCLWIDLSFVGTLAGVSKSSPCVSSFQDLLNHARLVQLMICSKGLQHQVYQKICPVHMAHMRCATYSQCSPPAVVQDVRMHAYRKKSAWIPLPYHRTKVVNNGVHETSYMVIYKFPSPAIECDSKKNGPDTNQRQLRLALRALRLSGITVPGHWALLTTSDPKP